MIMGAGGKNSPDMNELGRELFKTCRNFLRYQILAENEPSEVGRVFIFPGKSPRSSGIQIGYAATAGFVFIRCSNV